MDVKKDKIYKYQPLWGSWNIDELVGKGSYGSVYRVSREEMGYRYVSAVKFITVPNEGQYREAMATLENDEKTLITYFEDIVMNLVKEINILYEFKGNSNIISYEDHMVVKSQDEIGWEILIRMEYATSLQKYMSQNQLTKDDILRLGIDICSALNACEKSGIIHRDIKDENIFYSDKGDFKLGDFGIARELSKSGRAASMRGTPFYMAPEVLKAEKYGPTVDLYSLGIVMYKLLNNSRLPFMPPYPQEIKYKDSDAAIDRRIMGEKMPIPSQADEKLGRIVLKACAFNPNDRYQTAEEMRKQLIKYRNGISIEEKNQPVTVIKNIPGNQNALAQSLKEKKSSAAVDSSTQMPQVDEIQNTIAVSTLNKEEQDPLNGTVSIFTAKNKSLSEPEKNDIDANESKKETEQSEPISEPENTAIGQPSNLPNIFKKKSVLIGLAAGILIIIALFAMIKLTGNSQKQPLEAFNSAVSDTTDKAASTVDASNTTVDARATAADTSTVAADASDPVKASSDVSVQSAESTTQPQTTTETSNKQTDSVQAEKTPAVKDSAQKPSPAVITKSSVQQQVTSKPAQESTKSAQITKDITFDVNKVYKSSDYDTSHRVIVEIKGSGGTLYNYKLTWWENSKKIDTISQKSNKKIVPIEISTHSTINCNYFVQIEILDDKNNVIYTIPKERISF